MHWIVPVLPAHNSASAFPGQYYSNCISPRDDLMEGVAVHRRCFYRHCVSPFSCDCDRSPFFTTGPVEKCLESGPCFDVIGVSSPLSDILIKCRSLCQKGDTYGHHHFVGNFLPSL